MNEWDGVGLPPVGIECEFTTNDGYNWAKTKLKHIDNSVILTSGNQLLKVDDPDISFRPLKTEKERIVEEIAKEIDAIHNWTAQDMAESIYNKIIKPMRDGSDA